MDREKFKINIKTPDPGYEPFPVSIMNRYTYEATTFDPSLGKPAMISYRLNKAGRIRIRILHRDQTDMVIRTLQDWTRQEFGKYELNWDGRDSSGNIVDNRRILVHFESDDKDNGRQHKGHGEATCFDPPLVVSGETDSKQVIRGNFSMHTAFADPSVRFEHNDGLELKYFVDYKLLRTERAAPGTKRFDFTFDTSGLGNGKHLVTVNVHDLHDHIGSAGIEITVGN